MPTVSICIPAFRAEKFLPAALETVRAQTFSDWEMIVTEDGSHDRAEQIVRGFAASVSQPVIYSRHESNRGLPETRNTGIGLAGGKWIAFLDADDLWLPDHLKRMVAVADDTVDLVYAGCQIFDDASGKDIEQRVPTPESLKSFEESLYTGKIIIQPSAAMVRRSGLQRYGRFSAQYPICNDLEFWLRICSKGGRAAYSGVVSCRYRKHSGAMSQKAAALIAETGRIAEAYAMWGALSARARKAHPAAQYRNAARILMKLFPEEASLLFRQSLRIEPLSARSWMGMALTSLRRRHRMSETDASTGK